MQLSPSLRCSRFGAAGRANFRPAHRLVCRATQGQSDEYKRSEGDLSCFEANGWFDWEVLVHVLAQVPERLRRFGVSRMG